jgi:Tfp pilus assembly protein PilP
MFNGRLQPERVTLAVRVLFLLIGVLGLAAATGGAGQTSTNTLPSTDKEMAQVSPPSPKLQQNQPPLPASAKSSKKPAARPAQAESAKKTTPSILASAAGRRDPFKPWFLPGAAGASTPGPVPGALPAGIRGLIISELRLEGVVRQMPANTMIAVVTNHNKRAYFLRVDDTVYNGAVSRITPEAVYFKENTLDSSGRVATHEVELKLGSAPGEGR